MGGERTSPPTAAAPPSGRSNLPRRAPESRPSERWSDLVTVLLALGIVVVLLLAGYLPGALPSPTPSQFPADRSAAELAVTGFAGRIWTLSWAVGFIGSSPADLPSNYTYLAAVSVNCQYTPLVNGTITAVSSSNVSGGNPATWLFVFGNSTHSFAIVEEMNGKWTVTGLLDGYGCPYSPPEFGPVTQKLPGPESVLRAANDGGGYAFLRLHPAANSTMLLSDSVWGGPTGGPEWEVRYSTCPEAATAAGSGVTFAAVVNATDGALLSSGTAPTACPWIGQITRTAVSTALAVRPAIETTVGTLLWCNFTVSSVSGTLPLEDLRFNVTDGTGAAVPIPPGSSVSVVTTTGSVVGSYSFDSRTWTTGAGATLGASERLSVEFPAGSSVAGHGYLFNVIGLGVYSGSVSLPIP